MELESTTEPDMAREIAAEKPTNRWRRLLGKAFAVATGAYGLGVTFFLLLRIVIGEPQSYYFEQVEVINSFLHLILAPALVLLPVTLLLRRWRLALSLTPAVLTLVVSYAIFFLPRPVPAAGPDTPQISILTHNLHAEREALDALAAIIRDADADIVALQELSRDAADYLASVLADMYPHQALHPDMIYAAGQGILSRYPILEDAYWRDDEFFGARGHQRVALNVDGRTVTVYNVHPPNPFLQRDPLKVLLGRGFSADIHRNVITDLLARTAEESGPLLIVGDFNLSDQNTGYGRMVERYTDTWREVGWGMGFTYPDWTNFESHATLRLLRETRIPIYPLARLDYVFHNDDLRGIEARVWPTSGSSDHRPVFARLVLENP